MANISKILTKDLENVRKLKMSNNNKKIKQSLNNLVYVIGANNIVNSQKIYMCEYCGSKYIYFTTNCSNCGSNKIL